MAQPNQLSMMRRKLAMRMAAMRGRGRPPRRRPIGLNRRPSPYAENRRALLEEVIHPMFDTEAVATTSASSTPADLTFFTRPQGQAAATGFNKTIRDTNLLTAGQLARPKVHVVTGVRLVISQISGDTTSSVTLADFDFTDYVSTIRGILAEAIFTLDIGPKNYLKLPAMQIPANVGMQINGASNLAPDMAAGANETNWTWSLFSRGDYYSVLPSRLRIPSLQTFKATMRWTRALVNAITAVKITAVLDGISGREVQ